MNIRMHTGGLASTNVYALEGDDGWLVFDAPETAHDFLQKSKIRVTALALTHGHFDHMWDAAAIAKEFKCPVVAHQDDELMLTKPSVQTSLWGLPDIIHPITPTRWLKEGDVFSFAPYNFEIFHIPGHCPGSIVFYEKKEGVIFGGDVLFAGSIGRTDLPLGSHDQLVTGIREKLFPLPDATVVYPGHGPSTTIGEEKKNNPYL